MQSCPRNLDRPVPTLPSVVSYKVKCVVPICRGSTLLQLEFSGVRGVGILTPFLPESTAVFKS